MRRALHPIFLRGWSTGAGPGDVKRAVGSHDLSVSGLF